MVDIVDAVSPVIGDNYLLWCWYPDTGEDVAGYPIVATYSGPGIPGSVISTGEVADYAVASIAFQPPTIELSPATRQLVGVPTWLAVTSRLDYGEVNAAAGPVWASVRPTFSDVTFDLGEDTTVVCATDAATTWDLALGDHQSSTCTHTYSHSGLYEASATISWTVEQLTDKNPAAWQPWGTVTLTTPITIDVRQLQAVID